MGEERRNIRSSFLFAQPSLLSGIARVLDLWGVFDWYNRSRVPVEADMRALYSDWYIVGTDLIDAKRSFEDDLESRQGSFRFAQQLKQAAGE